MNEEYAYRMRMEPFQKGDPSPEDGDMTTKANIPVKSPNGNEGTIVYLHEREDGSEWATVRWLGAHTERMRVHR